MADEKQSSAYDVMALQTVAILSAVGAKITLEIADSFNPIRKQWLKDTQNPEIAKKKKENDTRLAFDLIGRALRGMPVTRKIR